MGKKVKAYAFNRILYESLNDVVSRFKRVKPVVLSLQVTEKCNATCTMCSIWKDGISGGKELSLKDYESLFSDRFFSRVSSVVLTGGEAVLRKDIVDIAELFLKKFEKLKKITLATNGLATDLVVSKSAEIAKAIELTNSSISFQVQVSIDGVSEIHDQIRGKGASIKVKETLNQLILLRSKYSFFDISAICVIQPMNLCEIEGLKLYLDANGIFTFFSVVCTDEHYYKNEGTDTSKFTQKQSVELVNILKNIQKNTQNVAIRMMYDDFVNIARGGKNRRGCPSLRSFVIIEPNGNIMPCLHSGETPLGNIKERKVSDIWFSEKATHIVKSVRLSKCETCSFGCGFGYIELFKYTVRSFFGP